MKKTTTLFALIVLSFTSPLLAQPTLNAANLNPVGGENFVYFTQDFGTNAISPGDTGANVTWDFQSLQLSPADTIHMLDCSSTPACGYFSGANIAELDYYYDAGSGNMDTTYSFIGANTANLSALGFLDAGTYIDTGSITGYPLLQYPLTFNDTFTSNYTVHYWDKGGNESISRGTEMVKCDGYGTLILPSGSSVPNVLRLHAVYDEIDSDNVPGDPLYYSHSDNYFWYTPGFHNTLFTIQINKDSIDQNDVFIDYYANYSSQLSTSVAQLNANSLSFDLYPNPAKDFLNVKFTTATKQDVSVIMQDLLGRQVAIISNGAYNSGEHTLRYNTSQLPKGVYVVRLQGDDINIVKKIEVL